MQTQNQHTLPEGKFLHNGDYIIRQKLAEGGFGITYLADAIDKLADRTEMVVIKEFFMSGCFRENSTTVTTGSLNPELFAKLKKSFIEEARVLYRFHEVDSIVNVRKFFEENNTAYFVMDYIPGGTLEEFLKSAGGSLSEGEALDFFVPLVTALSVLHRENVIHRDIKPQNILLDANRNPVLIDFGIARDFIEDKTIVSSLVVRSDGYSPPEQYSQTARRGPFTDIYALAATIYRAVTGKKPIAAVDRYGEPLESPQSHKPQLSDALDRALMKAMSLPYQERYQSVEDFWQAIDAESGVVQEATTIEQSSPPQDEEATVIEVPYVEQAKEPTPKKEESPSSPTSPSPPQTKPTPNYTKPALIGGGVLLLLIAIIFAVVQLSGNKNSSEIAFEEETTPILDDAADDIIYDPIETITVNGVSFDMIFVEGGTFTMGCTPEQGSDCYDNEKPAHEVTLSDYYIGQTEVTQKLGRAVMGENPSYNKNCDDCPVEQVSWNDCKAFIEKLNTLTGKTFRLPTEAEWEFSARGGNKSKGYKYAGSNDIDEVAWYGYEKSGKKTHPVAQKQANELGLYDMSGNVWEWCQDWYGSYTSNSKRNPTGAGSGSNRVFRGGGWGSFARDSRVSLRYFNTPTDRDSLLGFRLCVLP
ncbi:MAG: SUMF1/EgtB/PvdO family nonheme iron enzyme [Bernardetiaceae bacterium]|nr:SUMF1/EgtB/PvdO family nonheme iron enzyme [Bernardetiaceae bacterium]